MRVSFPLKTKVQPVSMTENFSISDGKSVIELDLGVAVEALGMPGALRSITKLAKSQHLTKLVSHCWKSLQDSRLSD